MWKCPLLVPFKSGSTKRLVMLRSSVFSPTPVWGSKLIVVRSWHRTFQGPHWFLHRKRKTMKNSPFCWQTIVFVVLFFTFHVVFHWFFGIGFYTCWPSMAFLVQLQFPSPSAGGRPNQFQALRPAVSGNASVRHATATPGKTSHGQPWIGIGSIWMLQYQR